MSAFNSLDVPFAQAAHAKDEMTPTRKIDLKKCTSKQTQTLKRASLAKKPAAIVRGKQALVVGGDNEAESAFSSIKRALRRQNQLGRSAPKQMHVVALAAKYNSRLPGLDSILNALAEYRAARASRIGCAPRAYLNIDEDKQWLWA